MQPEFDTIVLNLVAGPGSGKSTTAAHTFALLKHEGIPTELVTEVAKDFVWEGLGDHIKMRGLHLFSEQLYRMERLMGKVQVIVTDSPLPLMLAYSREIKAFDKMVMHEYNKHRNLNIFVKRLKKYSPRGRMQTEEEARALDDKILKILNDYTLPFWEVVGDKTAASRVRWALKKEFNV